jgi:signal transduction histidine kinase
MSLPEREHPLLIVVEDDPGIGDLERRELTRRGHGVLLFDSAEAALAAPERHDADCWLIDQVLPQERTGLDLVAELRRQGVLAPVVLVTGTEDPDVVLRALRAGVSDFVRKGDGFLQLLVTRVDMVIASARAARELQMSRVRAEIEVVRRRELEAEIAERRRAEAQAHAALARLRETDRRKDEFLAMLGHELRNPLAPIASAVEVLLSAPDDRDQVVEAAGIIGRQVHQLRRLVDDLLDVARIMNGRLRLQREPVDLREVANRALERMLPSMRARNHDVQLDLAAAPVFVHGDPVRLTQVLANLLDNAAKYTSAGGRIRLQVTASGGTAEVAVVDNGVGMRQEEIESMFGLFVQGERAPDRADGGLGLGLSLVHRIATMHGGEAGATSDGVGAGSRFFVRLPVLGAPSAVSDRAREPASPSTATGPAKGIRVLVVDDNADAATAAAMLLRRWGCEVSVEHDGRAAVAAIGTFDPEAVLLDLGLPHLDGCAVLAAAKSAAPGRERVWIAVTGYGQETDRERTRAAGFDVHLVKPVDVELLRAALARVRPTGGRVRD